MDPFVFGVVLLAAAFHASWNALIKIRLDPFLAIVLIAAAAGIVSLPVLLFVPVPPLAAWPWLIASVITHLGYYIGLSRGLSLRRHGAGLSDRARHRAADDRGRRRAAGRRELQPASAGSAFSALTARRVPALAARRRRSRASQPPRGRLRAVHRGDDLLLLAGRRHRRAHRRQRAFLCAVAVRDRRRVHHGDSRCCGAARAAIRAMARYWKSGLIGGVLSLVAYWIVIWAMTVAPIAHGGGAARDQRAVRRRRSRSCS